jgi:purine-binding chemotaxis protein CheW
MSEALDQNALSQEFVTFEIAGCWFGAAVCDVHDVFALQSLTPVPMARDDVAGLINLRGRIVTVIDARARLGLACRDRGPQGAMAIGIEREGESYGLMVDAVGEVLKLNHAQFGENPVNLDEAWRDVSRGVYRIEKGLLIALDLNGMLESPAGQMAQAP